MRFSRSIFLVAIVFCFAQAINAQGDFLKKYFPKEENKVIKLFELATAGDSAAFFSFANKYLSQAISQKNHELQCIIYEKYAIHAFVKGQYPLTFQYFDTATSIIEKQKLPDYNYYNVVKNRGVIKYNLQDYEGALKDYKKTEEIILKYQVGDLGVLYGNMATLYITAYDNINGKKYLFKALPFINIQKEPEAYIKTLKSLASIFYLDKKFKSADSLFPILMKLSKENKLDSDYAEILYDYCNSLKNQGKFKEAKSIFEELIVLLDKLKDYDWKLQVTLELAKVNLTLGNKSEALKYLIASEKLTPSKNIPLIEKIDIYKNSANLYHELGLYKKASEAFKVLYVTEELHKSIDEEGRLKTLSYQYEQKQDSLNVLREKEIAKLENLRTQEKAASQLRQQRIIIIVSIIGFIIVIGFSITLIKANRNKEKANKEITFQKGLLAEKNKEITDSITYAQRIQYSLLPLPDYIDILLPHHFLLYQPKDIVSGDFYWVRQINAQELFVAVADCTGHGVPGAMMSALSIQNLNELSGQNRSPGKLLSLLNNSLINTLNQEQEGFSKDGLDICLCKIDVKERRLTYSGANRSLQIFNEFGLKQEIKATKTGIGGHTSVNQEYAEHEVILEKNELVIMSTDGFADQFGGSENKKITTKRFKEWIAEIFSEELKKEALEKKYTAWKGSNEQIDDVCVLGFKI